MIKQSQLSLLFSAQSPFSQQKLIVLLWLLTVLQALQFDMFVMLVI